MIFYFSGTGNSTYIARRIGAYHEERVISIAEEMLKGEEDVDYLLDEDEIVGFVYPIYAWAPPKIVMDFIGKINLLNYKNNYTFSVATCGANIGNTMELLQKTLFKKDLCLNSGFSITMPNNYIIVGDVDSKKVEEEKLSKADKRLQEINNIIAERKKDVLQVEKGFMPFILTSVINPLFNKNGIDTKKFYATDDCIGCGLCESVCGLGNISMDSKPLWGSKCIQCLGCIHHCPTRAIQYGKGTIKKGRYVNPNIK